jgi:hypothetical protein
MLGGVGDFEDDRNLWIKKLDAKFGEIVFRIKNQPIGSTRKRFFNQKERFNPAVFIRPRMTQLGPGFIRVLEVKMDSNSARGCAAGYVEYVRRDGAHTSLESTVWSLRVNNKNLPLTLRMQIID